MSGHDDLCPVASPLHENWCQCDLIAKVRADEREHRTAEVAATGRWCREDERATIRAKVEALRDYKRIEGDGVDALVWRSDVLDLIDGGE